MIYLRNQKTIILTPPKCGSTTLDYIFAESPNSRGILLHGPQLGLPHIEKHTNILPFEIQNKYYLTNDAGTIAIAVRNPYTRALSIYNHYLRFDTQEKDINSFADFVKYRLVVGGHYFSQTLYEFSRKISTPVPQQLRNEAFWPNYVLHLETLKEDAEELGFSFSKIPNKNKTPQAQKNATLDDYTPETIALVRGWGEMDFNCFGYYKDFDKCHLVKNKTKHKSIMPEDFMGSYGSNFYSYLQTGENSFNEVRGNTYKICNIDIDDQKTILDFGCRAGRVTRYFGPDKEIHGVDVRKDIIDWCNEQLPYKFWANDPKIFKLPYKDNYFDFILSLSVFTHIEDIKEWLTEVIRTLKKDGIIYLSLNDEEATHKMLGLKLDYVKRLQKKLDFDAFLQGDCPVLWDGNFSFIQRDYFLSLLPSEVEVLGISKSELFQTAYVIRKNK